VRRLAAFAVLLAAAAAGACGGTDAAGPAPGTQQASPAPPAAAAAPSEPTPEQLAARRKLLADIEAGTVKCWCTSAERARDRIERGLAEAPDDDELVSALP
jgi:hypothetical protein